MASKTRHTRVKTLSHGRPQSARTQASISSKATRSLIRAHHVLEKQKAKALADGDVAVAAKISSAIQAQGGLKKYQRASLLGQASDRGGDSSKILMEWFKPLCTSANQSPPVRTWRLLEVGALSTENACSKSSVFEMTRIDLNSQSNGIVQQDFMARPLPASDEERFDVISLSLVLNFVPHALGRGEMLKRTLQFLRTCHTPREESVSSPFPCLFLVLPLPCVMNSRYLNEGKLEMIMASLGYARLHQKITSKLVYYLFSLDSAATATKREEFKKTELKSGKTRNNFAIVLK